MKPQTGASLNSATPLFLVSEDLLRQFAAEVSRAVLAEMGPLLPPFSKYALPPNTRKAEFCSAIARGAVRYYVRKRIHYVSRAEWDAYIMRQNGQTAATQPNAADGTGEPITVIGNQPSPANDARAEIVPQRPSAEALLEQTRRKAAARQSRPKGKEL